MVLGKIHMFMQINLKIDDLFQKRTWICMFISKNNRMFFIFIGIIRTKVTPITVILYLLR